MEQSEYWALLALVSLFLWLMALTYAWSQALKLIRELRGSNKELHSLLKILKSDQDSTLSLVTGVDVRVTVLESETAGFYSDPDIIIPDSRNRK